ncbi:uncharacterized protein LOC121736850 [Aricia agestis]|uniref:uncharacterized protein LOC121736850 n=1 Tax=Aricia agestis TaxID=91739 RepID=UPI001C204041|nr:uncharacterized protein LOC121736850 [Aricia agestis]
MDEKKTYNNQRSRFAKLSLKKKKPIQDIKESNRDLDCIILEESFDRLRSELTRNVLKANHLCSPIVINDSSDTHDESAEGTKEPSKSGNVSLNCTYQSPLNTKDSRPSIGGWSPAQNIICATPRNDTIPTTPKDTANDSLEQCSIKKIQSSHHKLLNDLYGDKWKSIPSLFKTISHKYDNFNGISKKLFDDDESDKENIRTHLVKEKELYLSGSDVKQRTKNDISDKRCKKKLYTEKIPSTPDLPKQKPTRKAVTTIKKKGMTVTEMVGILNKDVDALTNKIQKVKVTPSEVLVNRFSFVGSLADNVPSWRCHIEALQYHDSYKTLREKLARRLFEEFNKSVFDNAMDADLPILWDSKLRSTAGTTTNRLIKTASGDRIRTSSVKLSTKVLDTPQRLRDTLIHELCHAATWLIDGELRAGHGPLWKKWATKSLRVYPELGEISRCHDMEIHYKYSYKCTRCGYSIKRHSKSIDVTKKCCGYCHGTFEVIVNKKNKDGVVVSTPARKGGMNEFAQYVKENYSSLKDGSKTHAQVMKLLGEQFSAKKNKNMDSPVSEIVTR